MAKISKIKPNDVANGQGINVSVWFQGCPHHCKGCFNMKTWDFAGGEEFTEAHIKEIFKYINKDGVKRNLSILGGEALCEQNIQGAMNLCKKFKEIYPNKKIYVWTGYVYEDFNSIQKEITKYVDIIVDGKFEIDKKDLSLSLRGSSNQRIIDVKETLKQNKIIEIN